ncbi:MAG: SRPBCC family protein, partial [Nocardioidaceae bacterium]
MTSIVPWARRGALLAAGLSATYLGLVTGAVPVDIGVARRTRPLGPIEIQIGAPPDVVFDVIEQPYATRTSRAMQAKVQVLDRGTDMVLSAHRTPIRGRLVATTVETVRFTRPRRVDFRLVRGPVPYVVETFELTPNGNG